MGSNLSRHNGKGLTGRRTQSSGNLCDPKGKLNSMGKILVPCSSAQRERYKFCGSLPNHLDDKDVLDDDPKENNNIMTDTITGNLGGTLPHKKRSLGVHFSDGGPTGTLDLVKHRSQDSLDENDPWRYQQSDLDLVRCRHGNFDSVRRNRSVDTVSGDSARRYARGTSLEDRCHRNSDLDLVDTLPKRKQDIRNSGKASDTNSSSSQPCIPDATNNDLLMQIVHKPDCELVRHRQQFSKCIDLKLSKLAGGEPQDQGYASERSPEDEHPPSLPGQPFPNITPESTFRVTLQKSSRGLGLSVSGGGTAGPVRVKRLFPQQPAALSNKLQPGDILLAANGIPLTGLTNYEALEVLRTTPSTVELVVCRLPGDTNVTPPGAPPPPPARREPPPPLRILNPLPPLQIEPCGEFDIEMTKVGGSLGFTLRKADSSALGHYVRALVREPALSDGRIRPGDKIVAVDGAPLSPMSHEEAVQLLRQCGPTVRLRLYRDLAQTPVSALSPTEPDHPLRPPRTSLRQEAVDMLCDLAVRKLSPGTSSGSSCKQSPGASCNSPRRLRRLATRTPTADNDQETLEKHPSVHTTSTASQAETSDSDQCSIRTQITNSQPNTPGTDIIDPPPLYDVCDSSDSSKTPTRPSFLDLSAPQGKPHFQFCSLDSDLEYPGSEDMIVGEDELRNKATETDYERREANMLSSDEHDNDLPSEPASMPPVLSSTCSSSTAAFSYKNPAYQSANPACGAGIDATAKNKATHSSDQDIPGKILGAEDPGGSKGLLKWKGVMFAPDDGIDKTENEEEKAGKDTTDSAVLNKDLEQGTEVFMVELTRGWNSRLGFSLQPEGKRTVISVVHPDSVAAKDGRLKQGDVLMMVNDESVEHMSTADIIDLLRKIRGSIGITVMRRSKRENVT
ncbi:Tyrosine-protein phosphatase non-receptor type 13 [Anthophora retusa]